MDAVDRRWARTLADVEDQLDADAVARVLRRAQQLADERGATPDAVLDQGGVSPDAVVAAADEVGIDPSAVREALALERFAHEVPDHRRLDRLVGAAEVSVQATVARGVDDTLKAIQDWLTSGYQMRCTRTTDTSLECRPRSGIGASMRRAATQFTDDENIHPVDLIVVEAHAPHDLGPNDEPTALVRIAATRRAARVRRLGGVAAGGAGSIGAAVVGVTSAIVWWPVASVGLLGGGVLIARSGSIHADRVEVEMVRVLSAVVRGEPPSGIAGRAARKVRNVVKSVRSNSR